MQAKNEKEKIAQNAMSSIQNVIIEPPHDHNQ